ncbi:MAG: anhydro-N-acetylmuramic acid kinase [Alphaproteobacteria bacterium]|nr:anhydro-N-acetylmuramic acid kinase [Alphaproteobacteria bacterium]
MTEPQLLTAIGLMSGTSMDGIDAALVRTDGCDRVETGPAITVPYEDGFRARLRGILGAKGPVPEVEAELTDLHARAVETLMTHAGLAADAVDLVGFHGHTIWHEPEHGRTRQIGDGQRLAATLGIDVVGDFRTADMDAGGEGAPLAPVYHRALVGAGRRPAVVLNMGGVANVTWIGEGTDDLLAFDTGPGNAPIDDWCWRMVGRMFDQDGRLATAGQVDAGRLERLLAHLYFDRTPPKSLDRDAFHAEVQAIIEGLSVEDGATTLTAFAARTIAQAARWFPFPASRWIATGGGRHNPALMAAIREAVNQPVEDADAQGWDGDALEAQAFAYLAVRARLGLPISFPGTTGVARPMTGGVLFQATARRD